MSPSIIEQGSAAWHALRAGKVTASRVADIMRKVKSGPSASRQRYLGELVAERYSGSQSSGFKSADMAWGNETEPKARAAYEFIYNAQLTAVAFVDHPTISMSGASPDRLVGEDGLLEIKCPATHTHIEYLRGGEIDTDYLTQMQWQMASTGRKWCDWMSFDPRMPVDMQMVVRRVPRDPRRIVELETAVRQFLAEVDETMAELDRRFRKSAAA